MEQRWCFSSEIVFILVGGFNPSEKYARQIRSFPLVGVQINNVWNHHLVMTFGLWKSPYNLVIPYIYPLKPTSFFRGHPKKSSRRKKAPQPLMNSPSVTSKAAGGEDCAPSSKSPWKLMVGREAFPFGMAYFQELCRSYASFRDGIWKICYVKLDHFPIVSGWTSNKCLTPQTV